MAVTESSPKCSCKRSQQRTDSSNQAAPKRDFADTLDPELPDVDRQERHHEVIAEVLKRNCDRDGDLVFSPLRLWHRLLKNAEQAEDRFCVLDPAVIDHLKGLLTGNGIQLNRFIFVKVRLRFYKFRCFGEMHELSGAPRSRVEASTFNHLSCTIARLLFEFT